MKNKVILKNRNHRFVFRDVEDEKFRKVYKYLLAGKKKKSKKPKKVPKPAPAPEPEEEYEEEYEDYEGEKD